MELTWRGLLGKIASDPYGQKKINQKVRNLRVVQGRGTALWSTYVEYHPQFLGMESLVGYAVSSGHLTCIQNGAEMLRVFPDDLIEYVEGAVAVPIVLANQAVGGIYIASTQPDYFSQAHLALIQKYVELMCLAFERDEFYALSDITLGIMPRREQQLPLLIDFHELVIHQIIEAAHTNCTMTRTQAEKIAWQQLEEKLLRLAIRTSVDA